MPRRTASFHAIGTSSFTANNVQNPTSLTPGLPTRADRELLLCFTWSLSITATVSTPSGWTLLTGFPLRSGTASGGSLYVFARVSDPTDAAPTVTWTGLTTGTSGDASGASILSYKDVFVGSGAGSVLDGSATSSDQAGSTTTVTVPSITTAAQNSMRIAFVLKLLEGSSTWTPPSGFNERLDTSTTTGTGHTLEISDAVVVAAGSTGTTTAAPTLTTSSRALGVSFALRSNFQRGVGVDFMDPAVVG